MDKIDLTKSFRHLYQASAGEVVEVDVPPMNYLMIDGRGDPNTSKDYADAVEALFSLSYTLKFMIKRAQTLHVGPFSAEGPTIARVHAFITQAGRKPAGKHHEIYLSDIRKADPANWKTIVRQPMH